MRDRVSVGCGREPGVCAAGWVESWPVAGVVPWIDGVESFIAFSQQDVGWGGDAATDGSPPWLGHLRACTTSSRMSLHGNVAVILFLNSQFD
ncbi:hypothetical protein [Burkholderia gladioli]|uniref:hypothetical protein n=1 Tax=Burkholderia gladioli TaxID=28095 RepID=UPI00163FCB96|nr:hypothetical protein [Burkholderia gladioli]